MEILAASPSPFFTSTMQSIAKSESDPLKTKAHAMLEMQAASAAAAGQSGGAPRTRGATAGGNAPHA
jgi:hypothetical protein